MKGLARSISRGGATSSPIIKQTLRVSTTVTVDGATGAGWGTVAVGGLPQGNMLLLGAVSYMTFTGPTSASLTDTWEGDYGLGTTPADDGTITAADIDLIGSTPIAAATAEVSPRTRGVSVTATNAAVLDNTAGALEVNLNLLIDDASISADGIDVTVEGVVYLSYVMLGDD